MAKTNSNKPSGPAPESSKKPKSKPPAASSPQPPFVAPKSKKVQRLESKIETLSKQIQAIEALKQQTANELSEETRKDDNRRSILVGEVILTEIELGNLSWEDWLKPILNVKLQDKGERELFRLTNEVLPPVESPQKDSPQVEVPQVEVPQVESSQESSTQKNLSAEKLTSESLIRKTIEAKRINSLADLMGSPLIEES